MNIFVIFKLYYFLREKAIIYYIHVKYLLYDTVVEKTQSTYLSAVSTDRNPTQQRNMYVEVITILELEEPYKVKYHLTYNIVFSLQ